MSLVGGWPLQQQQSLAEPISVHAIDAPPSVPMMIFQFTNASLMLLHNAQPVRNVHKNITAKAI